MTTTTICVICYPFFSSNQYDIKQRIWWEREKKLVYGLSTRQMEYCHHQYEGKDVSEAEYGIDKICFQFFSFYFLCFCCSLVINNHERQWKEPFAVAGTYLFSLLFLFQQWPSFRCSWNVRWLPFVVIIRTGFEHLWLGNTTKWTKSKLGRLTRSNAHTYMYTQQGKNDNENWH